MIIRPNYDPLLLGTPINIQTQSFEAKMAQASIMQSVGYEGMITELSQGTSSLNQQSLISKDSKRTRRSQEQMPEVKKKKFKDSKIKSNTAKRGLDYQNTGEILVKTTRINHHLPTSSAPRLKN